MKNSKQEFDTRDGRNNSEAHPGQTVDVGGSNPAPGTPSFEDIYRDYGGRILNLLYRFTSREQVARDLLQDVFIKVYEHMDSFENRSQIYTWIYRIAVNHALNHLKRERRSIWFDLMDETVADLVRKEKIDAPGFGSGEALRPDEALEDLEREQHLKRAIDSLDPKYRIPFLLFRDEHLQYDEIAKVLDLSHSAVESRIHRARKMLVKKLSPLLE